MVEKLILALDEKGWTQSAFERAAMLSENRVSKWKNGNGEPTAKQALRMARLLEIPLDYLVDDEMDAPAPGPAGSMTERERQIWELVGLIGPEQAWYRLVGVVQPGGEPRLLPPPVPRITEGGTG